MSLPGDQLIDWGGAQRWVKSSAEAQIIREIARQAGGHATSHTNTEQPFQPLAAPLLRYQQSLKSQLDPQGIFNPGRMYAEI